MTSRSITGIILFSLIAWTHAMPMIYRGFHLHGGDRQAGVTNIEDCLHSCARHSSGNCNGFDFNAEQRGCWLHFESECGNMQAKAGCVHYRFVDCKGSEFDELSELVHFPNSHGLGGTYVSGMGSVRDCYSQCKQDGLCSTFDWDARFNGCWLHGAATSCQTLVNKEGCTHYRLKTDCNEGCKEYIFRDYYGFNRPNGVKISEDVTFEQCKALCSLRQTCKMVDYDINQRTCWEHTTEGSPIENSCCRHSTKVCSDGQGSYYPDTTTPSRITPTTASPVTNPPNIIPDNGGIDTSGRCPSELQAFSNTRRLRGTVVPGILTVQGCQEWCINPDNMCFAVDFNSQTNSADRCYYHSSVFTNDDPDVEKDACCTQFRKVDCAFKTCVQHVEKDVTRSIALSPIQTLYTSIETEVNIDPSEIGDTLDPAIFSLVPCEGSCVVQTRSFVDSDGNPDVYQPQYMSRRCEPGIPPRPQPNKRCQTEAPARGTAGELVSTCTCTGDKCNAFGNTITRDCIVHYPLDSNTFDLTQNQRNGVAYNLEYEGTDVAKNWSARFTGQSFVQVTSLKTILLGSLGEPPLYQIGPYFTVSLWFKLTKIINGPMTLLSNGARGVASLEVYTLPLDATQRMMIGTVKIGNTHYSAIGNALYNQWYNLMLMVTVNPMQNVYSLKLFLTAQGGDPVETETLTNLNVVGADIPRVTQLNNPLCIGKQFQPGDSSFPYNAETPGDFYVGLMDELYLFGNDMSEAQRNSVRSVSYDPRRFNP